MSFLLDPARVDKLLPSFSDKDAFDVVLQVFTEYPQSSLESMSTEDLNLLLAQLNEREDVKRLQQAIENEVRGHGQRGLEHIAAMMFNHLPVNKSPRMRSSVIERREYDEIQAVCMGCGDEVAMGNFERGTNLDNVFFKPENIFYAHDLGSIFNGGKLHHTKCGGSDFAYAKKAQLSVYREKAGGPRVLEDRVKKIIQGTADAMYASKSRSSRYLAMQTYLVDSIYPIFTTIKTPDGKIDYQETYRIFEWMFRENINLSQFGFNKTLQATLMQNIAENMLPIHGIINSRLKSIERIYEKGLEVLFNIHPPEDAGRKDERSLQDVYGVLIMVNKAKDCYSVVRSIKKMNGFEVSDEDDAIKNPRPRGDGPPYRSYDLKISDGWLTYEIQVRTHEMDRIIRTSPNLKHDEEYLMSKRVQLNSIPFQARTVFAALMGHQFITTS